MTDVAKDEVKKYLKEQIDAYRESIIEKKKQLEATNKSLLDKWLNFKPAAASQEQDGGDEVDSFLPITYTEPTNPDAANQPEVIEGALPIGDDEEKYTVTNSMHAAINATTDAAVHNAAVVVPNLKEDLSKLVGTSA